jgi:hypothetical protein
MLPSPEQPERETMSIKHIVFARFVVRCFSAMAYGQRAVGTGNLRDLVVSNATAPTISNPNSPRTIQGQSSALKPVTGGQNQGDLSQLNNTVTMAGIRAA